MFTADLFKLGTPRVDGLVVLTHLNCDTSRLGQDAPAVIRIDEFLRLKDPKRYGYFSTPQTTRITR